MAITGFTQGLSILAAQRFGSGDRAGLRPILSTFLVVLLPLSILCAAFGVWASGSLLHLLHTPENILIFAGKCRRHGHPRRPRMGSFWRFCGGKAMGVNPFLNSGR